MLDRQAAGRMGGVHGAREQANMKTALTMAQDNRSEVQRRVLSAAMDLPAPSSWENCG
jgi:hypothetical protein